MLKDLEIEQLIAKDIQYQLDYAEMDLNNGRKEATSYRLHRVHDFCKNLENRLADAIEALS